MRSSNLMVGVNHPIDNRAADHEDSTQTKKTHYIHYRFVMNIFVNRKRERLTHQTGMLVQTYLITDTNFL